MDQIWKIKKWNGVKFKNIYNFMSFLKISNQMQMTRCEGEINYRGWSNFLKSWREIRGWGEKKKWPVAPNLMRIIGTCRSITLGCRELSNTTLEDSVWWLADPHVPPEQYRGRPTCQHVFLIIFNKYNLQQWLWAIKFRYL